MNPFEIRLELLKLAQNIEFEKMMAERIRLENDYNATKDKYSNLSAPPFPSMPFVQVEEVIKTAETLNAFVSKKD